MNVPTIDVTDRGDVSAIVPARLVEDHDDCLAAAIDLVAQHVSLYTEGASASWDSDQRDAVIVTGSLR